MVTGKLCCILNPFKTEAAEMIGNIVGIDAHKFCANCFIEEMERIFSNPSFRQELRRSYHNSRSS